MRNVNSREIDDLSRNIQGCMTRCNDIFAAIGRLYYNQNMDNPSGEYVQMFSDLKATQDQIDNMQTRIKFLNGIVVCSNCKADNSVSSSFCSVCGTRLPHTYVSDGTNRCNKCGNIIQPGQKFCSVCGEPAPAPFVPEQPAMSEPAPAPFVPEQPVMSEPAPAPFVPEQPVISEPVPEPFMPEQPVMSEPAPEPFVSEQPVISELVPEPFMPEQPVMSEPAPEPFMPEQPVMSEPAERRCPQCGMPVTASDAIFCEGCGCRL